MTKGLDTATLKVELDTTEAVSQLASLRSFAPLGQRSPREAALQYALDSLSVNATPPGAEAIVTRAEAFLAFLDPTA